MPQEHNQKKSEEKQKQKNNRVC